MAKNKQPKFQFSLKQRDLLINNTEFSFKKMSIKKIFDILQKLNEYQQYYWEDIYKKHFHKIPADYLIKNKCPAILEKSKGVDVYQLSFNKVGRIIGYKSGTIFYVIGVDPKHELYLMS